jgi:hypothetical protein
MLEGEEEAMVEKSEGQEESTGEDAAERDGCVGGALGLRSMAMAKI